MYGGFEVFKCYLAIKLHFTTDTYNYDEYGGKVNCKLETFTKRNDRYFFHKLSKQYDEKNIVDFFVANFTHNNKKWVGNLLQNDCRDIYLDFKKRKESFSYHFRNDLVSISDDFNNRFLSFDDELFVVADNIHDCYVYLFKKERLSRPSLCLTTFCRLVKIGIKKLPKKLSGLKSHLRLPS